MSEPTSPVRVAVVQFDPQVGIENCDANLCRSLELALEAVNGGANLIVLPELSSTGYFFSSRQDAFAHAQLIPGGPSATVDRFCLQAQRLSCGRPGGTRRHATVQHRDAGRP